MEVASTQPTLGQAQNVSRKGVSLLCDNPLPVGSDCKLSLLLGGKEDPVRIDVGGKVARVDETGMGLEITEIVGMESFEHLRNLVLYNSSDTDRVEEEFQEHLGLKQRE